MEQDVLIAATLAAGLFPRAPNLDVQKAAQIYFDVLDALQTERGQQPGVTQRSPCLTTAGKMRRLSHDLAAPLRPEISAAKPLMHRAAAVSAREPPLDLADLLVAPPAASFRKFRARSPGL